MLLLDMTDHCTLELTATVAKCTESVHYWPINITSRIGGSMRSYFAVQSCVGGDVIFFSNAALTNRPYSNK